MTRTTSSPPRAAVNGVLLTLPFLAMNAIVGKQIEPFFSLVRPGIHTSPQEYVLLFVVVMLIAVGAFTTARPMLHRGTDGQRRFYPVNALLATVLSILFVALVVGLGSEIYRCDVLGIPNCD
jgi:hypothetical protein